MSRRNLRRPGALSSGGAPANLPAGVTFDFAWVPYDNAEGYADGNEVTSSAMVVGGRTLTNPGGVTAPTWNAARKAVLFNAIGGTDQYLTDSGSAAAGTYKNFHAANADASIWLVCEPVTDVNLQTLFSTARLATDDGIRFFTDDTFDDNRVDLYATGDETENKTSGMGGAAGVWNVFGASYDDAAGVPNFAHLIDNTAYTAGLTTFSGNANNQSHDAVVGALASGNDNGLSAYVRAMFIKWGDHANYVANSAAIVTWAAGL